MARRSLMGGDQQTGIRRGLIGQAHWKRTDDDGITIDGEERSQRAMSTARLTVPLHNQSGSMKIHVHEMPGQPILLSIKALKLGKLRPCRPNFFHDAGPAGRSTCSSFRLRPSR